MRRLLSEIVRREVKASRIAPTVARALGASPKPWQGKPIGEILR